VRQKNTNEGVRYSNETKTYKAIPHYETGGTKKTISDTSTDRQPVRSVTNRKDAKMREKQPVP